MASGELAHPAGPPGGAPAAPSIDEVIALVREWVALAGAGPDRRGGRRREGAVARLLRDRRGAEFLTAFTDRVVLAEDRRAAARAFEELSRSLPGSLPGGLRVAVQLGGGFALLLPRPLIPLARWGFRRAVRPFVVDAGSRRFDAGTARLRDARLELEVPGATADDEGEAELRLGLLADLLERDDVDAVGVPIGAVAGEPSLWDFEASVARVAGRLAPVAELAAASGATLMICIGRFRELDLTIAAFTELLGRPALRGLEAGVTLPAALPDAYPVLRELTAWARRRRASGGAGIRVRLVTGGDAGAERVEAATHGWPLARWPTRRETDAALLRMLDWALTPEHVDAVRVGVATHDPMLLAYARLLAVRRGVEDRVVLEQWLGWGDADLLATALGGERVLRAALVHDPDDPDAVARALLHRFAAAAGDGGRSPRVMDLVDDDALMREAARLEDALAAAASPPPATLRTQNRLHPGLPRAPERFRNEPPTDPAIAANRAWARGVLERAVASGSWSPAIERISGPAGLRTRIESAARAGAEWGRRPVEERAAALDRIGEVLAVLRGRLAEAVVAEHGATIADADAEASAAVDAAWHAAARARELAAIRDAEFAPVPLVIVSARRGAPVSDPATAVFAALAAGSAVVLDAASCRGAAVLIEAIREAGMPADLVRPVLVDDESSRLALLAAPDAGRVRLIADWAEAVALRERHPALPLLADTAEPGSIVVTPAADLGQAAADLVASARPGSGGAPAISEAILVGSAAGSERLQRRLAAAGIRVVTVGTLDEAIELQNADETAGVAGISSLDPVEVARWLASIEAGVLVVNRAVPRPLAAVRPGGGWKRAVAGPVTKLSGPNALIPLGSWRPVPAEPDGDLRLHGLDDRVVRVIESSLPALDYRAFAEVRRAAFSDEEAWRARFGRPREHGVRGVERDVLRYRPAAVSVRLAEGGRLGEFVRVLAAGVRARAVLDVSAAAPLPVGLLRVLDPVDGTLPAAAVRVEPDAAWIDRVARERPRRIRLIGSEVEALASAIGGDPAVTVWSGPVTAAGRIELLPFLLEQTVTMTTHRHGVPDRRFRDLPL